MKLFTILPVSLLATGTFLLSGTMSAQVYDDLYYTPGSSTSNTTTETYTTPDYGSDYGTSDSDYRVYSDDFSSEKYYDEDGNTYVVNNYYYEDDWDDYSYSMYVNRFYTPYYGFSYYSPCYDPWFWRPGWGWNVGYNSWTGWNVGWGYSWGWCSGWGWGYGNPWYNPYYSPWYSPYAYYGWGYSPWYNPYHYGWGNAYYNGYNNGYWNGYANGYYDGYYNGYGNGYYYGPREATASNTGDRDYTSGVMGTDRDNGAIFSEAPGRGKSLDNTGDHVSAAQDRGLNSITRDVHTSAAQPVEGRDQTNLSSVKVVKHYSAQEAAESPVRGDVISRPDVRQERSDVLNNSTQPKGYESRPSDQYQWRDNSQPRNQERPAQRYESTTPDRSKSQPNYSQPRNNQSQPKYNNNSNRNNTPSQPKYNNSSSSSSNRNSGWNNSGSSSRSSSGTRSSGSRSSSSTNRQPR